MTSPYLTFEAPRVGMSVLAALVIVPLLSLLMKVLVEAATSLTYTIHWFETVPVIVLVFAFVINGLLNERAEAG